MHEPCSLVKMFTKKKQNIVELVKMVGVCYESECQSCDARQYIMVVTPWVNDRGVFFEGFKVNRYIVF